LRGNTYKLWPAALPCKTVSGVVTFASLFGVLEYCGGGPEGGGFMQRRKRSNDVEKVQMLPVLLVQVKKYDVGQKKSKRAPSGGFGSWSEGGPDA
jgi:hypothetical protein